MKELKEMYQMLEGMNRAVTEFPKVMRKMISVAGNKFLAGLISNTPVNKDINAVTRGQLKRNWQKSGITRKGRALQIRLYNNTEYASYVELGHRNRNSSGFVEGKFFMENTRVKMEEEVNKELNKILDEYTRKMVKGGNA